MFITHTWKTEKSF